MKPEHYVVPRELYEWLVEYSMELCNERQWKRNSTQKNNQEMAQMDEHISKALQIRDTHK